MLTDSKLNARSFKLCRIITARVVTPSTFKPIRHYSDTLLDTYSGRAAVQLLFISTMQEYFILHGVGHHELFSSILIDISSFFGGIIYASIPFNLTLCLFFARAFSAWPRTLVAAFIECRQNIRRTSGGNLTSFPFR